MSGQTVFYQVVYQPTYQTLGIFSSLEKAKEALEIYKEEFDESTIINIHKVILDNTDHADLNNPIDV